MAKAINDVYSNPTEIQNDDDENEESELIDFDTFFYGSFTCIWPLVYSYNVNSLGCNFCQYSTL
jgi:hypothetical protein